MSAIRKPKSRIRRKMARIVSENRKIELQINRTLRSVKSSISRIEKITKKLNECNGFE